MAARVCALALASFILWSDGVAALAQTFYQPVHRTARPGPQEEIIVRGQNEAEAPEDFSEPLKIESDFDVADSRMDSLWHDGGWYSTVEVASLNRSNSLFGLDDRWGEITPSPRFTLGWENVDGLGVRSELWHFRNQEDATVFGRMSFAGSSLRVPVGIQPIEDTASSLELDLYKRFDWGRDEFAIGSGLKGVSHAFTVAPTPEDFFDSSTSRLEGVGFSLLANARKSFYSTTEYDVAFIAEGRTSFLWGDSEYSSESYTYDSYEDFGIYEASIGVEWRHQMKNSLMYIRAQYESQLWDLHGESELGFTGTSVSTGIKW